MIQRIIIILILALVITSCGGAPAATQALSVTETFQALIADTAPMETPTSVPTATQTFTPEPTNTPLPTSTDTPLPPLVLPTEVVNAPTKMVWDGAPTYPGDSTPGYSFRVTFDPDLWALTTDQYGFPAIAHRNIPYCVIAPASGRGMPGNITVEHDVLYADKVTFDVSIAYENGVRKFVTYSGGDGTIITGFEVTFQEQIEPCLADAVMVLSTLRSVPNAQATPQP